MADEQNNSHQPRTVLLATDNKNSILAEIVCGKPNSISYSAYGQQSGQQEVATRLGFNGELREAQIGWYLLGNGYRAYNPRLMRFHSPDSWSPFGRGGLNAYMYCVGDPVNFSDPTGHGRFGKILSGIDKFLFGGAEITGPSTSQIHKAQKVTSPLGPMRPEKTGELKALTTLGTATASAPGPRGTGSPSVHNLGDTGKKFPGYGAAGAGSTPFGASSSKPARTNPNLQAGQPGRTVPESDTWKSSIHGPRNTHNRLLGGGDATGTHPRDRMAAVADRDRAFVEHRNQMRREALIAAMQVRNEQLRRAGQPSREFREAVVRREARGMLARINAWLQ